MVVRVKVVAKAKVSRAHRAMALHPLAATALKAAHALKAKAMVAEKVAAMVAGMASVKAAVAKSNVAIPALTTARMAKAVPRHAVRAQRVVAEAVKGVRAAGKTAIATMAMNCHATLTP